MRFVLLLSAAIIAVIAGIAALNLSSKSKPDSAAAVSGAAPAQESSASVATVEVLVARDAIPVGTVLDESMVDKQPWPAPLVLDNFITTNSEDANVVGKVVRSPLQAREPLMRSKLANPNDPSFLAAALPQGMRAVTIATDAISGIAGYVFPGDRVDILVTHNLPRELKMRQGDEDVTVRAGEKPEFSEVLVPGARVLAVNLREPIGKKDSGSQAAVTPTNVTLEVTEENAQKIKLAEKVGTLSLVLRSLKDQDAVSETEPTSMRDVSNAVSGGDEEIRIVRGAGRAGASGNGQVQVVTPAQYSNEQQNNSSSEDMDAPLIVPQESVVPGVEN